MIDHVTYMVLRGGGGAWIVDRAPGLHVEASWTEPLCVGKLALSIRLMYCGNEFRSSAPFPQLVVSDVQVTYY